MDPRLQDEIIEQLQRLAPDPFQPCPEHSDAVAEYLCPDCGSAWCRGCMVYLPVTDEFRCRNCQVELDQRVVPWWLTMLRTPFFYIGATFVIGFISYFAGVGNPSLDGFRERDADKQWHRQRVPKIWLEQGVRAKTRATYLRGKERATQRRHWAKLAYEGFYKARQDWRQTEAAPHIQVAEAQMLAMAGKPDAAEQLLAAVEDKFPSENPSHWSYVYQRGKIAFLRGDVKRGTQLWNRILDREQQTISFEGLVDALLSSVETDRSSTAMVRSIQAVCGTAMTAYELEDRIIEGFTRMGISSDSVAPEAEPEPTVDDVKSGDSTPQIEIQHF